MDSSAIVLILSLVALMVAITFHEFMHAWTANYLGDPTAKAMGRVSLNPLAHIDPFGTVIMPLLLVILGAPAFGWAKPVQMNPNNFKNYRMGQVLTAIAGPMANLILVLLFAAVYKFLPDRETIFGVFVYLVIQINVVLMVFNLIPIPPLDGSKLLYGFLPFETIRKFEMYGPFVLIPFIFLIAPSILPPVMSFILRLLGI